MMNEKRDGVEQKLIQANEIQDRRLYSVDLLDRERYRQLPDTGKPQSNVAGQQRIRTADFDCVVCSGGVFMSATRCID